MHTHHAALLGLVRRRVDCEWNSISVVGNSLLASLVLGISSASIGLEIRPQLSGTCILLVRRTGVLGVVALSLAG